MSLLNKGLLGVVLLTAAPAAFSYDGWSGGGGRRYVCDSFGRCYYTYSPYRYRSYRQYPGYYRHRYYGRPYYYRPYHYRPYYRSGWGLNFHFSS